MGQYINNKDFEKNLKRFYEIYPRIDIENLTFVNDEQKQLYEKLFLIFFEMSKQLAYVVFKKTKFYLDRYMIDDLIMVGTMKGIKEIYKFDFNKEVNPNSKTKTKPKAFNFFTTVIKNEMIQVLMKDERKNWYRNPEKLQNYKIRIGEIR